MPGHFMYAVTHASWSSVFVGGLTAFSLSILFTVLGMAFGFKTVQPKSENPLAGMGMVFGGWSLVCLVVSMAGGGFMAGLFAGQRGLEHGFLVWALVLVVATLCGSIIAVLAAGAAMRTVGGTLKTVGSGMGNVASAAGRGMAGMASGVIHELKENIHFEVDADSLTENVTSVLRDTEVEKLQPDYLKQQMREARSDLRTALHDLAMKPGQAEETLSRFLEEQKRRLGALTEDMDRDSAVSALMKARSMPREEAEKVVDSAMSAYGHAVEKARESLEEARAQVEDMREYVRDMIRQAREKADKAASTAARGAVLGFLALLLAMAISMGAAACGERYSAQWHPAHPAYFFR